MQLFEPVALGKVTVRNRVVMPPMVAALLPDVKAHVDPAGHVTPAVIEHYARRAAAGTGLIMLEATAVDPRGRCWSGGLCVYDDDFIPGLTALAQAIKAHGAVAGIQLVHGGPQASAELIGGDPLLPDTLTLAEIDAVQQRFVAAAERCVAAGFDVVELHGAHGFLLDSFISPEKNTRTDGYGGDIAGRIRMLVETCGRVVERVGVRAMPACRISAFNHLDEGYTVADFRTLVTALTETGIRLLDLSVTRTNAMVGYFDSDKSLGQWAREFTPLPRIIAGFLNDPAEAERVIREGHAEFAAVGRAMLADPAWTRHAAEALGEQL